ncbi:MAG: hypothetical protein ACR2KF_08580 [Nitrososphaeraceae archaeon]
MSEYNKYEDAEPHKVRDKNGNLVSSHKVEDENYEEQPIIDRKKYWTALEQTRKTFADQGFDVGVYNEEVLGGNRQLGGNVGAEIFFQKVDVSKDPITQTIDVMHRQKAIEYFKDKDGREKQRVKEFLTYNVRLQGFDWLGNILQAGLEYEGRCDEPKKRVHIDVDKNGRQHAKYILTGLRHKYYIPFTKVAVDDLLKQTNTDKDSVKWYGKFGLVPNTGMTFRCGDFSYEQFVNTSWEEFTALSKREGGPNGKVIFKTLEDGSKKYIGG